MILLQRPCYQWKADDDLGITEITRDAIEQLDEHATQRMAVMVAEGYVMGELNTTITIKDKEYEVDGWWAIRGMDYLKEINSRDVANGCEVELVFE